MTEISIVENKSNLPVTPSDMLQIAVEQGADLDKLEKLMELQEIWEASQAKKVYISAMAKFKSSCPPIQKTKKGHNCLYSGLAESIETIKPSLSENGLSHSWNTEQSESMIKVTCIITHEGGHQESTSLKSTPETSGSKNSIQSIGSAVSYLERYTLFAILGLASSDQDTDGKDPGNNQPVFISEEQIEDLKKASIVAGVDEHYICKKAQIPSLDRLLTSRFEAAKMYLQGLTK